MLNECNFIGNLGADPEIKTFNDGGKVANLRLAVTQKWTDKKSGEKKERTEWVSIVLRSDGLVGVAERFLKKGSKIYVKGALTSRKWQDQSGQDRYSTEVVVPAFDGKLIMLDGPAGQRGGSNESPRQNAQGPLGDDFDDDVPF